MRRAVFSLIVFVIFSCSISALWYFRGNKVRKESYLKSNKMIPDFSLSGNCGSLSRSVLMGKPYILLLYSPSCSHCLEERVTVRRFQSVGAATLPVLLVAVDSGVVKDSSEDLIECRGEEALMVEMGLRSVPAMVVVDAGGIVRKIREGKLSEGEWKRIFKEFGPRGG